MLPKVSIIILNWNGWADTLECLASLNRLDYNNFEIILIDNASKERPPLVSVQFLKLAIFQIFNEKNLGFAGGNNQGIKIALERGADYVLLLNNDTTIETDFLSKLIEAGENNKAYGIFGPVIYCSDEPEKIWFAGGQFNWLKTRGSHIFIKPSEEFKKVDYITGCCLLAKKTVIEKIGLLSEDYFLYYEDADYCERAKKHNIKLWYDPSIVIWHKNAQSTDGSGSVTHQKYQKKAQMRFALKYAPLRTKLHVLKNFLL